MYTHVIYIILYCYVNAKKLSNKKKFMLNFRERIRQSSRKIKYRASRYLALFSCTKLMCSCNNEAHIANYCNYKLSRGKTPGPPIYVDPKGWFSLAHKNKPTYADAVRC